MSRPRLLADMNISPDTISGLRTAGHDIVRVSERVAAQSPDSLILRLAEDEGRVLVSHDLDFSTMLATEGRTRPSLVTLRLRCAAPDETLHRLLAVLPAIANALATGAAVTVDETHVRIRRLPME